MSKAISAAGALLVMAGVALLGYVGWAYAHPRVASSSTWSATDRTQGKRIAQTLSAAQRVSVPSRLLGASRPVPGSEPAIEMLIPRIGVHAPVVQTPPINGEWVVADWAVGHLTTTPNPGAAGNAAYSAHDDIKGEIFKRVGELKPGDSIVLRTRHAVYTYVVTNQVTVDPSNTSVLAPTQRSTVTLISCTPYWVDTERLIVQGTLKSVKAA
jgi:LPXTG-site transpeptidase (sortase) family protein